MIHSKLRRVISSALTLVMAVFAFGVTGASADTATTTAQTKDQNPCIISQSDIAAIRAIQADPNLTYNQELSQELAARKSLLDRTITCAEGQIDSLKTQLQAPELSDATAKNIQSQLAGKLDDATNYYELERAKLTNAGLLSTQQTAREIIAWRVSTLAPLQDQINNFLLWAKNQPLFDAAAARMTQISQVVSFLSSTNNSDLATAFSNAQSSFKAAQDKNDAVEQALAQSLSSDQVTGMTQESLQSLANAYKNLFTVSTIIQNILPGSSQ